VDDLLLEVKFSRAFAVEFDKFWRENPEKVTPELLKAYMLLKQHYDNCMSKELS
jgi:hypothetical protein